MEKSIYEELDEAKAEIQKLKYEYRTKEELSETLKKGHFEQLSKLQEAIEKLGQELHEKTDENKELILALGESNEKSINQEKKMYAIEEEIAGLKELLSLSQRTCLETEKITKDPREEVAMLFNLEDKNRKVHDQEKVTGDLIDYILEIGSRDAAIKELKSELEDCYSSMVQLKLQNEENFLMSLVLKSGISEAQTKLANYEAEMRIRDKEREENASLLMKRLEVNTTALIKAHTDIQEEHAKAASLLGRIESLDLTEEQQIVVQKELKIYREMVEESSSNQLGSKEQALLMESDIRELCDALCRVNSELDEKICEGSEIEFEMNMWKSIAYRLKDAHEENQETRKQLEDSLLLQLEVEEKSKQEKDEKERRLNTLQQLIVILGEAFETEIQPTKEDLQRRLEILHQLIVLLDEAFKTDDQHTKEDLQKEIELLEQESLRRELECAVMAQIGAERINEKNRKIEYLLQLVGSLEQNPNSSLISLSSQYAEDHGGINLLDEAWENIVATEIFTALEIEEKKLMIVELQGEIRNIQHNFETQEKSLSSSRERAFKIEAELKSKEIEMKKLASEMEITMSSSDAFIDELRSEKRKLIEDVLQLSSERENLLELVGEMGGRISELSGDDDAQLMGILGRLVHSFDSSSSNHNSDSNNTNDSGMDSKWDNEGYVKENVNLPRSSPVKKLETMCD